MTYPIEVQELLDFCKSNAIHIRDIHRKPITYGCQAAISARSKELGISLPLNAELKTLLFETGVAQPRYIALHMPGSAQLEQRPCHQLDDHARAYREMIPDHYYPALAQCGFPRAIRA